MNTYDFIKDIVKPDGFYKENLNKLYKSIARVFDIISSDYSKTINNFFPLLASNEALEKHRISSGVIKFPIDSVEEIRNRISKLYEYYRQMGEKKFLITYLEAFFKGRYSYIEVPKNSWYMSFKQLGIDTFLFSIRGLRIYIDDLSLDEEKMLTEFLDMSLEADIEFKIFMRNKIIVQSGWRIGFGTLGIDTYIMHGGE